MPTMIEFSNITKQFPGNKALDDVCFSVERERFMHFLVKMELENLLC